MNGRPQKAFPTKPFTYAMQDKLQSETSTNSGITQAEDSRLPGVQLNFLKFVKFMKKAKGLLSKWFVWFNWNLNLPKVTTLEIYFQ